MISTEKTSGLFEKTDQKNIDRRTFFTRTAGCTAGLALMAFPGFISEVMASKGDKTKEEIIKELEEKAEKYLPMYGSCSQASFAALNEQFEMNSDKTIRALKPFTGGVALRGETCGAVSGAMAAIGLTFEPEYHDGNEHASPSFEYAHLFFDRFTEKFGSTRCYGVQEHQYGRSYNALDPEDRELFIEASKNGKCMEVVKTAVVIAGDIIMENS